MPTRAGRGSVRRGRPAAVAPESPGLIVALGVGHVGSDGWAVRHSSAKGGEPVESGLFDVGFGDGGHGSGSAVKLYLEDSPAPPIYFLHMRISPWHWFSWKGATRPWNRARPAERS